MNEPIGATIRKRREELGLTREDICGNEESLTIRQLGRIENEQSQPNIATIQYLAQQLGSTVYELMPDYVTLDPAYQQLKDDLIRTQVHHQEQRLKEKENLLQQIYDHHYEQLPLEEQEIIDILDTYYLQIKNPDQALGGDLITRRLPIVLAKENYDLNDLLFLRFFIERTRYIEKEEFALALPQMVTVAQKLLDDKTNLEPGSQYLQIDLVTLLANIFGGNGVYLDLILPLLQKGEDVADQRRDYYKKLSIYGLRMTYYIYCTDRIDLAEENYRKALMIAEMGQDADVLVDRIKKEWASDLVKAKRIERGH